MNEWLWVVVGLLAYWSALSVLRREGRLPSYVRTLGPILQVHTKRGRRLIDRIAAPKRLWRAWGNFGLGIALVVLFGSFLLLVTSALSILQNPPAPTAATQPRSTLVIPGVNPFLPLSVAPEIVVGLFIGMVVHEGGHGIMCRVEDIDIASMGVVLLAILPIGAFVEPDEESQRKADRGSRARMFAGGVTNNFLITLLAFGLLFGPVTGSIAVADGAAVGGVVEGSPAAQAGIQAGDRIVAVDNQTIHSNGDLTDTLSNTTDRAVDVRLASGETVPVTRSLLATGVVETAAPFDVAAGDTIASVNGTDVHTEAGFRDAVANRTVATLATDSGKTSTGPVGALVLVIDGDPLANAGLPGGDHAVITRLDGDRVLTYGDVSDALDDTNPGDTVQVEAYVDGDRREVSVTLGTNPNNDAGFLGVRGYPGYSGISLSDFGVELYPASSYLDIFGGNAGVGLVQGAFLLIVLPFASVVLPGIPYNFPGFVPQNAGFYTATGALEPLGGSVLLLANVLFWTGWINVNLGFFNCIPGYPLDGGHLLRTSAESVVSRLPIENKRRAVSAVTTTVGVTMLASLLVMIFGPQLLVGG